MKGSRRKRIEWRYPTELQGNEYLARDGINMSSLPYWLQMDKFGPNCIFSAELYELGAPLYPRLRSSAELA